MNVVIMMGRLTREPEIRYATSGTGMAIANYGIAVDRRFKREGQPTADFFDCRCFGKQAEFVEKYLHKGMKIVISGSLQNDNYQGRDGNMVYKNQILVENHEFAESKAANPQAAAEGAQGQAATRTQGARAQGTRTQGARAQGGAQGGRAAAQSGGFASTADAGAFGSIDSIGVEDGLGDLEEDLPFN